MREDDDCNHTSTQYDNALGHTVCTMCGQVLEENAVITEIGFSEKSNGAAVADGFFIGAGQVRAKSGGYNRFGMQGTEEGEKHANSLQNGNRRIAEIAGMVRMSRRHIEIAERYYKLAVIHGFTKGRRVVVVAACCLYIVCRLEKTSHMLMDFADVLEINVYAIGTTYMRLVIILNLRGNIEHIDPALFIQRFASKMEFEEKNHLVINDALRLVSRMDRDWIKLGRRPAGICAAALFIAARMHGFNRSVNEIVHVVKICSATLRKRLEEFSSTESANLTVEVFNKVWLETARDPPCFIGKDGLKRKHRVDDDNDDTMIHQEQSSEKDSAPHQHQPDDTTQIEEPEEAALNKEMETALSDAHLVQMQQKLDSRISEDLSCLDSDWEVANAVISAEEVKFKAEIWESLNFEYTQSQIGKKVDEFKEKKSVKKRASKKQQVPLPPASSAFDAVSTMLKVKAPSFSSKINYDLLKDVLASDDER